MGSYIPATAAERQAMLHELGCGSFDDLFAAVPESVRVRELSIPKGKSEFEVRRELEGIAEKNVRFGSIFRGAGAYWHYIPSIVKTIISKEEFVTAYTPYQAEISQGILQSIFEYQTMICELTGIDVSNASVYDGATAAAEAVLMCQERRRTRVLVSDAANPEVLEVIQTYCRSRGVPVEKIPASGGRTDLTALAAAVGGDAACVYVQQPNYYGCIEDADAVVTAAHEAGAKCIMGVNPIALGILKTPAEYGADIAVGEGQPLGMPLSFGGPYLGFIACTSALMRRLPGRIVGQTTDGEGRRAFVLTLQAREQHIRREKASSNICSNEALCAMTAAAYLSAMGPGGLAETAEQCAAKAHYAAGQICSVHGFSMVYDPPFFHEFVTTCPIGAEELCRTLEKRGILGGLPIPEGILWCVTEMNRKEQIDELVKALQEVCAQ